MQLGDWGQDGVDTDTPNVARMYDYFLGGARNFPADREAAQRIIGALPAVPALARTNRAFLTRLVRHLVGECGIRQLIDLGSGIPSSGNVHEIAQSTVPGTRVVYVDMDRTAILHSRVMLVGNPYATAVQADLRDAEAVIMHRDVQHFIDFSEPIAILATAVLHFVADHAGVAKSIATFYDHAAPGSYCVISHAASDAPPAVISRVSAAYARTGNPMTFRSKADIAALFGRFEILDPGLVPCWEWQPEDTDPPKVPPGMCYAAVAVKRS